MVQSISLALTIEQSTHLHPQDIIMDQIRSPPPSTKVPLQFYQFVLLEEAFHKVESMRPDHLGHHMEAFLPAKYFTFEHAEHLTRHLLKEEIIRGGSCAYEALIDAAYKAEQPELASMLTRKYVLYRWIWVWSEDSSILKRGDSWYVSRDVCRQQGKRNTPSYCTWDGPDSPFAQLSLESVCPCIVHCIEQEEHEGGGEMSGSPLMCMCFSPEVPEYAKIDGRPGQIHVDDVTISKAPFQYEWVPGIKYIIQETGDTFYSLRENVYWAYMERKWHQLNRENSMMECE